jgi:mRNA-degrading endonuclease YafQ of YafQ-DinJ toxin-antitoxin module
LNRLLLRSSSFVRAARRVIKRYPRNAEDIQATLELLSKDAFHPLLKTHKLRGNLKDSWACSVSYDLRIVFRFVQYGESERMMRSIRFLCKTDI